MKRVIVIAAVASCSTWFGVQAAAAPPGAFVPAASHEPALPKYLTAEEKLLPLPSVPREYFLLRSPPTGAIYCPAEYEPNEGLFIAWEGYTSVLTDLAVGITTGDPDAIVYVVVDDASEQSSAHGTLNSAGADMTRVEFIIFVTDSVWIRDYGPRFIFEDGDRAIIDHTYNRPRPNDNLLNDHISALWGIPEYDIPLTHGGGNFHLFSNGDAFMSSLILTENPSLSEQEVIDLYHEYQNLNLTIYPGFPTSFDSTRHIDMWMMPVDDHKIIIGEYAESTGQPYTITENAVADLIARGYTVYRTPGWNSGGTHYTYTNAVILNDQVFVSEFGGSYVSQDNQAKAVFEQALPEHNVRPVDCSDIIHAAGAIHCVVMHVPPADNRPALTITLPDGSPSSLSPGVPTSITVQIEDGREILMPDSPALYYRFDDGAFITNPLTPLGGGLYEAMLPEAGCEAKPEFYFIATGDGGTTVYEPEDAPAGAYKAVMGTITTVLDEDFENDQGWTVESIDLPFTGEWERDVPRSGCESGNPPSDHDGSGSCYLTDNRLTTCNSDVDGGPTRLISPLLDLSGTSDPILRYARWMTCDDAGTSTEDFLDVEISDDDGATWVLIESAPDSEGWVEREIHVADYVDLTAQFRLRFSVMDNPNNSTTEAGVDAIEIIDIACVEVWDGDVDGDGDVDLDDCGSFVECMSGPDESVPPPGCEPAHFSGADSDGDSDVDLVDFATFEEVFLGL